MSAYQTYYTAEEMKLIAGDYERALVAAEKEADRRGYKRRRPNEEGWGGRVPVRCPKTVQTSFISTR